MNDDAFFSEQSTILKALTGALIEATPESWRDFTLTLEVAEDGCSHTIFCEEHPDDFVGATTEIFQASGRLRDLFVRRSEPWKRATIRVWQTPEGKWKFKGTYDYERTGVKR